MNALTDDPKDERPAREIERLATTPALWNEALETLMPIFNPRVLHLGGGNAQHIKGKLPSNVRLFGNVDGMTGGIKLWTDG